MLRCQLYNSKIVFLKSACKTILHDRVFYPCSIWGSFWGCAHQKNLLKVRPFSEFNLLHYIYIRTWWNIYRITIGMDKSDKSKNLDYDHTLAFWSIQVKLNQNQSREAESRDVVSVLYRSFLALRYHFIRYKLYRVLYRKSCFHLFCLR